jgi:hypothetical protein
VEQGKSVALHVHRRKLAMQRKATCSLMLGHFLKQIRRRIIGDRFGRDRVCPAAGFLFQAPVWSDTLG